MGMQLKVLNSGTESKIKRLGSTSQMKDMTNALIAIDSVNGKKAGEGGWVPVKEAFEDFGFKICYDRNLAILTLLLFAAIARSGCSELISNARSVINQTAESTLDKKNVQKITLGEAFRRGDGKCIYSILNTEKFKNILKNQLLIDEKYVKNYLDRVKHITPWSALLSNSGETVDVVADAFASMTGQKEGLGDAPPTFVSSFFVINDPKDFKGFSKSKDKDKITDVEISDVYKIPSGAFRDCKSLKSVSICDGVKRIEDNAFIDCTSLQEVKIPRSVEKIGESAFRRCKNLKKVVMDDSSVKFIDSSAFRDCESLQEIKIPRSVEDLYPCAFCDCKNLKEVKLPNFLGYISAGLFMGCSKLEKVNIPGHAEHIYISAFSGCESLKRVVIPAGVIDIEREAFKGCKNLQEVVVPSWRDIKIDSSAFEGCPKNMQVVKWSAEEYNEFGIKEQL